MADYLHISSLEAAEDARRNGHLVKVFLLPAELGGRDVPENVVYVPLHIEEIKRASDAALMNAVRQGMSEVAVVPGYREMSFVPTKIAITATQTGTVPQYELEISVW